jgi:acetyl/propionyl-CoA carboxylase alpha subunit
MSDACQLPLAEPWRIAGHHPGRRSRCRVFLSGDYDFAVQDDHSATLVRWFKEDGDLVRAGDKICELETDKASVEMEAFATGVLQCIAKVGDVIRRGDEVARIEPISN